MEEREKSSLEVLGYVRITKSAKIGDKYREIGQTRPYYEIKENSPDDEYVDVLIRIAAKSFDWINVERKKLLSS
jgi:hypothetical protein